MNTKQKGFSHLLLVLSLLAALLAGVLWLFFSKQNGNITNNGVTYHVDFMDSHKEIRSGLEYLVSQDGNTVVSVTPSDKNQKLECSAQAPKAERITVMSHEYDLCGGKVDTKPVYITRFQADNSWHSVTIISPGGQPLDLSLIVRILQTIRTT